MNYHHNTRSAHNGVLTIDLGWRGLFHKATIVGGPYANFPGNGYFGVCLREEVPRDMEAHVHMPIVDFSVPEKDEDVVLAIKEVVAAVFRGDVVYVGCMGGWGRTGLFLSLLAKATGREDAVSFVRKSYTPKAVETKEQERYVENFDVSWFKPWLLRQSWNVIRGRDVETD